MTWLTRPRPLERAPAAVRLASLIRALAHGTADLGFAGHLQAGGKYHAAPEQLVDDLLSYLHTAASAPVG
jgi:hypothetical protein